MRAATHGCNEGSIEAGWLGQSHLPVMLNYVPTTWQMLMDIYNSPWPVVSATSGETGDAA